MIVISDGSFRSVRLISATGGRNLIQSGAFTGKWLPTNVHPDIKCTCTVFA